MPYKDLEVRKAKHKQYSKKWYEQHRELTIDRSRARKHNDYSGTCQNCGGKTVGRSKGKAPEYCAKPECRRAAYLSDPEKREIAVASGRLGRKNQGIVKKWKEKRPSVSLDDILDRFDKNTKRRDVG